MRRSWLAALWRRWRQPSPPMTQLAARAAAPLLLAPLTAPFEIPVLRVDFLPLRQGRLDRRITGDVDAPLEQMRRHIETTTARVMQALEAGSAYKGFRNPRARPSLRYRIVGSVEFLEPLPTWPKPGHRLPMTDYNAIMERLDLRAWVETRGVREVWLWGYHGGQLDLWESNMAGPFGDISNSDRDPHDLPVFDKTYTVYHYNYQRGPSEAVEDHMHQIEAILGHLDRRLFWDLFVGKPGAGRCGWSHVPPNGVRDYDWANRAAVDSDIEDWTPAGGPRQTIRCDRWQGDSLAWFIYWMQNLPGADNGLSDRGRPLSNWWTFIGAFDAALRAGLSLTLPASLA